MKILPDGGVELDGVKLTKEQVAQIKGLSPNRTGWWIYDNGDHQATAFLGMELHTDGKTVNAADGRMYQATNTANVIFWGTFAAPVG
jgi:hypothetical protein